MHTVYKSEPKSKYVNRIIQNSKKDVWDGGEMTEYFKSCRNWIEEFECMMIFSRDVGHHSSGWWKNPDYERCYHLSISFVDRFGNRKPHNQKKADKIVKLLYGSNSKLIWCEPPYSKEGIKMEVWHYRLFCDEAWRAIKPRGEVYSKQFTDKGWLSYSDVQYQKSII